MRTPAKLLLLGNRAAATVAFTPAVTANLIVRLDDTSSFFQASNGTTPAATDGDVVGYWSDLSGNGNHVTQATTANKPTLKLAANGINGYPTVLFDGANDSLAKAAFAAALTQPSTIYAVFKAVSVAAVGYIYDSGALTKRHAFGPLSVIAKYEIYAGVELKETGTTMDTNAHVSAALFNGASSQFWIDNTSKASGDAGAFAMDGLTVGNLVTGGAPFNMRISLIWIYNAAHSSGQRQSIQAQLATRYGVTLS